MPMYAAAGGALIGGIAGAKKKPARQVSELERQASANALGSLNSFAQMTAAGANIGDVTAGAQSQRDLGALLKQYQGSGMYDMAAGKTLSNEVFGQQRQALQMAFQDQMAQANKAASLAGRSTNDPILRARLAQEQMRQQMQLNQGQAQATLDFARQSVTDQIGLAGQRASVLGNLGNQAMANQSTLFGMSQNALASERQISWQQQQFDATKGGGWMGALSGAMAGAGAGLSMAQGMGGGGGAAAPAAGGSSGSFGGSFMQGLGQGAAGWGGSQIGASPSTIPFYLQTSNPGAGPAMSSPMFAAAPMTAPAPGAAPSGSWMNRNAFSAADGMSPVASSPRNAFAMSEGMSPTAGAPWVRR